MTEAVSTSETSVSFYQTTRRSVSEDSHLQLLSYLVSQPVFLVKQSVACPQGAKMSLLSVFLCGCLLLLVRSEHGKSSSDIFRCGYEGATDVSSDMRFDRVCVCIPKPEILTGYSWFPHCTILRAKLTGTLLSLRIKICEDFFHIL
jgi:hypothetical protein